MAIEIERKFLITNDRWRQNASGTLFRQGYLCSDTTRTVRVRLEGDIGKLTIKGKSTGISRCEYEYEISADDAAEMLETLCSGALVEKTRHRVEHAGMTWEVDEFHGDNAGLIVAEIELASEDTEFVLPDWAGAEVSDDRRYYNASLAKRPYKDW